jgi:hypothetical protein
MQSSNDADLVRLARAGNRGAFGELIRRYQHQIWGLACILVDDRFEAEDATQEAFLRAWLNLDLLSDPAKFAPWLRRIVFGVSIDWLRVFRPDFIACMMQAPGWSYRRNRLIPSPRWQGWRLSNCNSVFGTQWRACLPSTGCP